MPVRLKISLGPNILIFYRIICFSDLVDPDFDPNGRGYKCPGNNIFSPEELEEQCGPKVLSDKYATVTYFPDPTQPNHIPIPNPNPFIGCKNPDAKICKFKVGLSGPK